jgi:hypothetical protein
MRSVIAPYRISSSYCDCPISDWEIQICSRMVAHDAQPRPRPDQKLAIATTALFTAIQKSVRSVSGRSENRLVNKV